MIVKVKWQKQRLDVELDQGEPPSTFKTQLWTLTGVPVERQKLMAPKVWKGMLKDDADFSKMTFKEGQVITMMGTAEVLQEPSEKVVFVEDLSSEQKASVGTSLPAGLRNLGNTCYMNAALQCFRKIPELRQSLAQFAAPPTGDPSHTLVTQVRSTYEQLDRSDSAIPPMMFWAALKQGFPQFGQTSDRGMPMQQDSEEFVSIFMSSLAQQLKFPPSGVWEGDAKTSLETLGGKSNLIEALFGIELEDTLVCEESEAEPAVTSKSSVTKLVCNIQGGAGSLVQVNHMNEGIKLGMEGSLEKHALSLNRNAIWKKTSKVKSLPRYLCVQFMRFYWKPTPDSQDHAGVKCKILKPVTIPMKFDIFEFCSTELQGVLKVARDKFGAQFDLAQETSGESDAQKPADAAATDAGGDTPMADADAASREDEEGEALQAALAMSMKTDNETSNAPEPTPTTAADATTAATAGVGLPADFQGEYELFALVTHKGRSADSGHYMSFVKADSYGPDDWLCFDDEDVQQCKTEHVQELKGGGDHDMQYLCFYRWTLSKKK